MNIMYIAHENQMYGASKSLLNIIDGLPKDYKICVVSSFSEGPFIDELKKRNVEIIYMQFYRWCETKRDIVRWTYLKLRWHLRAKSTNNKTAEELANIIKERNINIVHVNTSVIGLAVDIKKYCSVKVVWHLREFGMWGLNMYPMIPIKDYYGQMNRTGDLFICNSKAVKDYYSKIDENKKIVIYNCVDENNLFEKEYGGDSNDITFLISGRICEQKGQEQVLDACEILLDRRIKNFHLLLAGDGDIYIPEKLTDYVTKLGFVKDMPSLRKKANVELVCSVGEAFGRSTAEAMMSGLPVIGSDSGGTHELIEDGITGHLYQLGNPEELANKMSLFITRPKEIEQIGRRAQESAKKRFLPSTYISSLLKAYKQLLKE